ncbi:MAG: hypothetical protein PSX71_14050 [bacterium]|nr:hypothetical protein [bacterium]
MADYSVRRHDFGVTSNKEGLLLVAGVAGLGFYLWHRAKAAVSEAAAAVDPTNPENVANTFAKKIAAAVTGQKVADVSFAPNVAAPKEKAGAYSSVNRQGTMTSMSQAQKLAWLDNELSKLKVKLLAAKTTADRKAINATLTEYTARRAAVAAGAV